MMKPTCREEFALPATVVKVIAITIPPLVVKAFNESGLRMMVIPENVIHIAEKAFANCESLFYVTLPRTLTDIADDAFDPPEVNPLLTFYVYPGSYGLMWAKERGYPVKSAEV